VCMCVCVLVGLGMATRKDDSGMLTDESEGERASERDTERQTDRQTERERERESERKCVCVDAHACVEHLDRASNIM
jgi:hypothetical protein